MGSSRENIFEENANEKKTKTKKKTRGECDL
jgi:hypothetical protein